MCDRIVPESQLGEQESTRAMSSPRTPSFVPRAALRAIGLLAFLAAPCDAASPCHDEHTDCQGWAASGECDANPAFMHVSCKLSCNLCAQHARAEEERERREEQRSANEARRQQDRAQQQERAERGRKHREQQAQWQKQQREEAAYHAKREQQKRTKELNPDPPPPPPPKAARAEDLLGELRGTPKWSRSGEVVTSYALHIGKLGGRGAHLHSGNYELPQARAWCDATARCAGFFVQVESPVPNPAGAQRVHFRAEADSVSEDIRRAHPPCPCPRPCPCPCVITMCNRLVTNSVSEHTGCVSFVRHVAPPGGAMCREPRLPNMAGISPSCDTSPRRAPLAPTARAKAAAAKRPSLGSGLALPPRRPRRPARRCPPVA